MPDTQGFESSFGYIENPAAVEMFDSQIPKIYSDQLDNLPYDLNRPVIMYRHVVKTLAKNPALVTNGRLRARNQGSFGSCVGFGGARAALFTASGDIWIRRQRESWPMQDGKPVDVAPAACYGMSRQINGNLGGSQGSNGAWMMDALHKWGVPWEIRTPTYDLREYSTSDCSSWQRRGVPKVIIDDAKKHPCNAFVRVRSVEQAVALVQNGYGMHMCCGYGWTASRDEHGFTPISGRWPHCQFLGLCYVVYRVGNTVKRGIGCQNSWGDGFKREGALGALTPDLPLGSYIISLADLDKVIKSGVIYGVGDYQGFNSAPPNWEVALGW